MFKTFSTIIKDETIIKTDSIFEKYQDIKILKFKIK